MPKKAPNLSRRNIAHIPKPSKGATKPKSSGERHKRNNPRPR